MSRIASTAMLAVVFLLSSLSSFAEVDYSSKQLRGSLPYTPSRLEWFAVELNAGLREPLTEENRFSVDFVPIEKDEAILIYVRYLPDVNREIMNRRIDTIREVIAIKIKSYGWES